MNACVSFVFVNSTNFKQNSMKLNTFQPGRRSLVLTATPTMIPGVICVENIKIL